MEFEICYLADRPDCIDACAAWDYGRWGVYVAISKDNLFMFMSSFRSVNIYSISK